MPLKNDAPLFAALRTAFGPLAQAAVDAIKAALLRCDDEESTTGPALRTSPAMQAKIKGWEGCKLVAYLCPARVWTVGYGSTGPGIHRGVVWTLEQAEARFQQDLALVERDVRRLLAGGPCTQGQWDALVSFGYNCGTDIDNDATPEGLGDSTLMRCHLVGLYAAAAHEFGKWVHGGGKRLAGLVTRRAEEAAFYRGDRAEPGDPVSAAPSPSGP